MRVPTSPIRIVGCPTRVVEMQRYGMVPLPHLRTTSVGSSTRLLTALSIHLTWSGSILSMLIVGKVETLEGYEDDSRENFKRQIEGNYRGRLDQRFADVDGFRAFSAKWSTRKLVLFEDLIERKEELQVLTKRISRRMGDIAAKSLANEFFFKSLIPKQREELQLELISNKVVYPESDYPPMKEMLDILHGCVSIDNVVATNVRESLNPDVETNAQLIEREVIARQAYLERQRQPQARSMYLFGPEIFTKASMTEAKTPGVGVKTLDIPCCR